MSSFERARRTIGVGVAIAAASVALSGDASPLARAHGTERVQTMDPALAAGLLLANPYSGCHVVSVSDEHIVTKSQKTDTSGSRTTVEVGVELGIKPEALPVYDKYQNDTTVQWGGAVLGLFNLPGADGQMHLLRGSAIFGSGYLPARATAVTFTLLPKTSYALGTHEYVYVENDLQVVSADRQLHRITGVTPCTGGLIMGRTATSAPDWQLDPGAEFPVSTFALQDFAEHN